MLTGNNKTSLAMEWHCKAAEQGDANAQVNLGVMYLNDGQEDDACVVVQDD